MAHTARTIQPAPAFVAAAPTALRSSSFTSAAVCRRPAAARRSAPARAPVTMGKNAKFGVFTPAVIATKLVIGQKRLNQMRSKAIVMHTQVITRFCNFTGTDRKTRQELIKAAKNNGNTLGFLY